MKTWLISLSIFLLCSLISMLTSNQLHEDDDCFLHCLTQNSDPSQPILSVTYAPTNSSFSSVLQSYVRNLRFATPATRKPSLIITPTHFSHVQVVIICARSHDFQIRIRSGGHDYDGLSYVSEFPFVLIDMFNLRSVDVDMDTETAWVESGATLGEVYYGIHEKSKIHGFPAGVCPTVGAGGHFSGAGYGNMMRKYGLSVDQIVDAKMVNAYGRLLDRRSMGEDLFWAIRGGGGASFGVILSWKIKLVRVPEIVTVFKVVRTVEEGVTEMVHKWQHVADQIDNDLFIRVVVMPSEKKGLKTIKAKFVALFLGNAERLMGIMNRSFPELGLQIHDCKEMGWIESVLFWSNYPMGTSTSVLLDRMPSSEKFLKKKSDYVQRPISMDDLEGIWKKMMELKKPVMTLNPYGGRMSEISESETPFPHREGNLYKIQYSVNWKEEGKDADAHHLELIRNLYDYMTPYVSESPRASYLNYRDVDLGVNENGRRSSSSEANIWGTKYF